MKRRKRTQKINQIRNQVNDKMSNRRSRITTWYLQQSTAKKVALGLVIIPILIAIFLLQGLIWPLLGLVIAASKFAFVWVKGGAFIVYISYKVFKGLLGVYLCVSRSLNGWKAHKLRAQQASLPSVPEGEYPAISYTNENAESLDVHTGFKQLNLSALPQLQHRVVFSYLRYFIIGQIFMYLSFWRDHLYYLTLWRKESRDRVKEIFQEIGGTIFTPHQLGPHINIKRILVPGDARLMSLDYDTDKDRARYTFEVTWRERQFKRQYPFFNSIKHQAMWAFELPSQLDMLSPEEIGYKKEVGAQSVEDAKQRVDSERPDQTSHLDKS
jgi:hypothetical protein